MDIRAFEQKIRTYQRALVESGGDDVAYHFVYVSNDFEHPEWGFIKATSDEVIPENVKLTKFVYDGDVFEVRTMDGLSPEEIIIIPKL